MLRCRRGDGCRQRLDAPDGQTVGPVAGRPHSNFYFLAGLVVGDTPMTEASIKDRAVLVRQDLEKAEKEREEQRNLLKQVQDRISDLDRRIFELSRLLAHLEA